MAREAGYHVKVTLPAHVAAWCEAEAERRRVSLSQVVREAVEAKRAIDEAIGRTGR
jgi:hypothetical protein